MVTVAEALAVQTSAVGLLIVRVHERVAPVAVVVVAAQTSELVVVGVGLTLDVGVAITIPACAAVAVTRMLNTWATPTSFTASGVIEMWASPHSFRRLAGSVAVVAETRWSGSPRTS